MIIEIDENNVYLRVVKDVSEFLSLETSSPHHLIPPMEYPAIYYGHWYNDPNGPEGIIFESVIEGFKILDEVGLMNPKTGDLIKTRSHMAGNVTWQHVYTEPVYAKGESDGHS